MPESAPCTRTHAVQLWEESAPCTCTHAVGFQEGLHPQLHSRYTYKRIFTVSIRTNCNGLQASVSPCRPCPQLRRPKAGPAWSAATKGHVPSHAVLMPLLYCFWLAWSAARKGRTTSHVLMSYCLYSILFFYSNVSTLLFFGLPGPLPGGAMSTATLS